MQYHLIYECDQTFIIIIMMCDNSQCSDNMDINYTLTLINNYVQNNERNVQNMLLFNRNTISFLTHHHRNYP